MGEMKRTVSLAEDPVYNELRDSNARLLRQLSQAKARTSELVRAVERAATDAATSRGKPKIPKMPKRLKSHKHAPEVPLIHLTDWQVGKLTATYSSDIAYQRLVNEIPDRVADITELHRASGIPVNDCAIAYGGDMVEGVMIFPGQAHAIDATLMEQVFLTVDIIEAQILAALDIYRNVYVYCEKGNHGRIGTKGDGVPSTDNMDLLVYRIAAERFKDVERVRWHHLPAPYIFHRFNIGEYKALLFHGDEIKNAMGNLPMFAIVKRATSWRSVWTFHDAYAGHYHTAYTAVLPNGGRVYGTGSPESDNDYATEYMGALSYPSQRMNFILPEKGKVTAEYTLTFDYEQDVS